MYIENLSSNISPPSLPRTEMNVPQQDSRIQRLIDLHLTLHDEDRIIAPRQIETVTTSYYNDKARAFFQSLGAFFSISFGL